MNRTGIVLALVGLGALSTLSVPGDANACGGCFAPPNAVQVVTDHRMVLSLSTTQTVLWDQIRYSGQPSEFSWILPIRNGDAVRIEVADNRFMSTLDNLTAPVLTPPPRPYPPYCGTGREEGDFAAPTANAGAASDAGTAVQVLNEQVVGPYMTVTVRGTDPMALRTWLADNGYSVPAPVSPVIDYYVGMHMDFLALKLRPGEGIDRMQPVRIISPGYAPTLPLRMIAAGTADKVGLLLFVIADSRVETQNFPNGEVADANLTYDFNHPTSPADDFNAAFGRLNAAQGGRLWLTESSQNLNRYTLQGPLQSSGGSTTDVDLAFQGRANSQATVTRLRADLALAALDRDLALAASDHGPRDRSYQYGHVLNRPADYPTCAEMRQSFANCSISPGTPGSGTRAAHAARGALAALALAAAGLFARRRR